MGKPANDREARLFPFWAPEPPGVTKVHYARRKGPTVRAGPFPLEVDQYTETPYTLSGSVTGWKNVVPPDEQLPLPPEVRPSAVVPA